MDPTSRPIPGLRRLSIEQEYRSDTNDTVEDFYVPCLSVSMLYRRAVGFFTSESLELAAKGIEALIRNQGKMQLVASPRMEPKDIEAIERGYRAREEVVSEAINRQIPDKPTTATEASHRWECLAWMVANGLLDIKIALPAARSGPFGIYHEKIGIFEDRAHDVVAFSGSANETAGGLFNNFESIDVFKSWVDGERTRVERKIQNFQKLWENRTPKLTTVPFPKACSDKLLIHTPPRLPRRWGEGGADQDHHFHPPRGRPLRGYQEQAIRNWFKNNGRGMLKMATGSGKTLTALYAAQWVFERAGLQAVLIVCPYRHLVEQWAATARDFGLDPILAYDSRQTWLPDLNVRLYNLADKPDRPLTIITTNATFSGEAMQAKLKHLPPRTLLIADEVHNLGAGQIRSLLPESIPMRMGLSATPERWFDDSGTAALVAYFGDVLKPEFTLKDALDAHVLVPYDYYPILVELTPEEAEEYAEISAAIARVSNYAETTEDDPRLTALLLQRARLIGTASNKLQALRDLMSPKRDESHMLFYCGDGSVEDEVTNETRRQLEAVCRLLGRDLGIKVAPYTAETPVDERIQLGRGLDTGEYQGLVAIRCLDEGLDIPSIRMAVILASSSNPRQFIQRRGRILRTHPGKERAKIYDMIVVPPWPAHPSESERSLVRKELARFAEFADLALNSGAARLTILDLQRRFSLLDV